MLSTICGGLMIGMGIGVVIRCGASTGGMDIPPLVLNKKFGLPVSVMLYVFDFVILISQMLFTNKEEIVYGILLVLIYTVILDKVLLMGSTRTKVEIMTEKFEELNRLIQEQLDRGTTLVYTQTGYLKNDQPMILTVVSNRELMRLNQLVQETDPHAFMIIGNVNEVRGRGFSQQKVYKRTGRKIRKKLVFLASFFLTFFTDPSGILIYKMPVFKDLFGCITIFPTDNNPDIF